MADQTVHLTVLSGNFLRKSENDRYYYIKGIFHPLHMPVLPHFQPTKIRNIYRIFVYKKKIVNLCPILRMVWNATSMLSSNDAYKYH